MTWSDRLKEKIKYFLAFVGGCFFFSLIHVTQALFFGERIEATKLILPFFAGGFFGLMVLYLHQKLKKYHAEALEATAIYRDLVENIYDIVYSVDSQGNITYVSPVIKHLTGYEPAQLASQPLSVIIYQDDLSKFESSLMDSLSGRLNPLVFRIVTKTGGIKWVRCYNKPIFSRDRIIGLRGVIVDITDLKTIENNLSNSEAIFRLIFNNAVEIMFIHLCGEKFLEVNDTACAKLGYSREEILKISPTEIFSYDASCLKRHLRLTEDMKERIFYETEYVTKAGILIPVEVSSKIIDYNGVSAVLCSARDISDRKELLMERQRAEKLESLGVMAGGIAHEFNNLLMAVLCNVNFVKDSLPDGSENSTMLSDAMQAAVRMKDLTQQLLVYSRQNPISKVKIDIKEFLKNLCDRLITDPAVKYEISSEGDIPLIEADGALMETAFSNIIRNAVNSMPHGGRISIKIESIFFNGEGPAPLRAGSSLKISIADTGDGIPQDIIEKIFDPFFTTYPEKSGLGLANAFTIMKRHNGFIDVSSEEGRGSVFTVYLPADRIASVD